MRYYLCSSLVDYSKMELHNEYHWVEDLLKHVKFPCHALLVASSPDEIEKTRRYAQEIVDIMDKQGLCLSGFDILDRNSAKRTKNLLIRRISLSQWVVMFQHRMLSSKRLI